jgi:selT/selW/selH-like putative selenoprotein
VQVRGDVFTPGPFKMAIAQMLQLTFFGGLGISLVGKGMLPASAKQYIEEHQMQTLGALFMCNVMSGQLLNTGAFEIAYDGKPVWSKIDTNRFPNMDELVQGLSNAGLERGGHAQPAALKSQQAGLAIDEDEF